MESTTTATWVVTSTPLRRLWDRTASVGAPVLLLASSAGVWFGVFALLVVLRHDRFGTFDHDLGIWDQSVWLLSRGHGFNTVRGLGVFGFHASPALYLFVPFYWVGAGPNLLNVSMVAALTAGVIPLFAAARHHLRNDWFALVIALAFLVNYAGQWMMHETFHPEVMAVTPLLFAYLASLRERWWPFALWLVLAVAWKEDVALATFMLGFLLLLRRQRKAGIWTMALSALWFLFATQLLIPAFSPEGNFTSDLFGDLGSSPQDILATSVEDPSIPLDHLDRSDAPGYVFDLGASFGLVPFLSPTGLLIGLPQALINLLAIHNFFWTTKVHYAAMPLAAMGIAAVEGVARPRSLAVRRFLVGAMAVGAFYTAVAWGVGPLTHSYRGGFWPLDGNPRQSSLEAVLEVPGEDDSVAASYDLVPHLSHRRHIYTFPNPWQLQNWGVEGEDAHDPATVDWIVLDLAVTSPEAEQLLTEILAGTRGAEWDVVLDNGEVLVARRVGS